MREFAFGALALAFLATFMMIFSAFYSSSAYNTDCTDTDYLNEEYGEHVNDKEELCEENVATKLRLSSLLENIGYPLLLFSLVLMIGANRLQET